MAQDVTTSDSMLLPTIRRVVARLQLRRRKPSRILFICHGNLCRSPFAAALLRELTDDEDREFDIRSAGFQTEIPTPPRLAIAAAAARSIDLSEHVSQSVTRTLVRDRDLIVVMEPRQRVRLQRTFRGALPPILVLGDLDPKTNEGRAIADPILADREVFDAVYARIARCVTSLAQAITDHTRTDAPPMLHIRNTCSTDGAAPTR